MDEYIFSILTRNEAVTFGSIEPLHGTLFHGMHPLKNVNRNVPEAPLHQPFIRVAANSRLTQPDLFGVLRISNIADVPATHPLANNLSSNNTASACDDTPRGTFMKCEANTGITSAATT